MPKFKVDVTETVYTYYQTVEVEADTMDNAILKAEAMAMRGELTEGGGRSDWSSGAELVGGAKQCVSV